MFKFFKKQSLGKKLLSLFQKKVDEGTLEELERIFFEADLGVECTQELIERVRTLYRKEKDPTPEHLLEKIKGELLTLFNASEKAPQGHPHVIMVVGTNGNGKTTTVAKLACLYKKEGKKVLLAACDTFRAAGVDQLDIWAKRLSCDIVKGKTGGDAASAAFDAITAAKARGFDVVIIDTAGRLHTKAPLMQELEKIARVSKKVIPEAPHETLLVIDATNGKTGVDIGQIFHKHTPLTGIILTKVDGTAKGGVVLSLQKELALPICFLGTGEQVDDFVPFDSKEFVNSLLS